jgi:hypothetical protein
MRAVKAGFTIGGVLGLYVALVGAGDPLGLTLLGSIFGTIAGAVAGEA